MNQDQSKPHVNNEIITPIETKLKKWICSFCNKPFSHQGSYGKHLDYKKGDNVHPLDEVDKIRKAVKRRDGSSKVKKKTQILASSKVKLINDSADNKEKTKIRRKLRDRHIKSKLLTQDWLINQFGTTSAIESFADLVALYLSLNQWPTTIPDSSTYERVSKVISDRNDFELSDNLLTKFMNWQSFSEVKKQELWKNAKSQAIKSTIGDFCLNDLANLKTLVTAKENFYFEQICEKDGLLQYVKEAPVLEFSDSDTDEFSKYFNVDEEGENEDEGKEAAQV